MVYDIFSIFPDSVREGFDSVLDYSASLGTQIINSKAADFFDVDLAKTKGSDDPIVRPISGVVGSSGFSSGLSTKDIILLGVAGALVIYLIKK